MRLLVSALLALGPVACSAAPAPPLLTAEDEVIANVLAQSAGSHTVADLDLPEEFLRRIADRIVRSSWQERTQRVLDGRQGSPPVAGGERPSPPVFRQIVEAVAPPPEVERFRDRLREGRPALRGLRLSWLYRDGRANEPLAGEANLRAAAELVARNLEQGLLETTAAVVKLLGPARMAEASAPELAWLESAGLPVDWLAHFYPRAAQGPIETGPTARAERVVRTLAAWIAAEPDIAARDLASRFAFRFEPSQPGFVAAVESGEHDAGTVRLQLTRGDYWRGSEDGGSVDVARQLFSELGSTDFLVSIERRFEPPLQRTAAGWGLPLARVQLLLEPRTVSQWAQDNGKAGAIVADETARPATLIPRYASRREDGSELIPSETWLMETVAHTGHPVVQSPLLFQGGDLLIARHPASGERVAFVGEAELWRNWTLGLSRDQVLEAFRTELAVERVEVLPSISFHLDFDVSFRQLGGELIALVNDREAAARIIAARGLDALVAAEVLDTEQRPRLRDLLTQSQDREFVTRVAEPLLARARGGVFPYDVVRGFEQGARAGAVADFERFLVALDLLAEPTLSDAELSEPGHRGAYFRSLRRHRADSAELDRRLATLGARVIAVPGISEGSRSVCYLNGVHTRKRYFMSAYGGNYAELDRAAAQALAAAFGEGVEIVSIRTAESQQRMGGLHCSVAVHPPSGAGGN